MPTPRKYPTLAEFEKLKEAVSRMEQSLTEKQTRPSVCVDAIELCERLGLTDAYDVPVAVGDEIATLDGGVSRQVREIALRKASADSKATVHVVFANDQSATAVDMRLPNFMVTRKATA